MPSQRDSPQQDLVSEELCRQKKQGWRDQGQGGKDTACLEAFQLGGEGGGNGEQGMPEFWLQVHWDPLET